MQARKLRFSKFIQHGLFHNNTWMQFFQIWRQVVKRSMGNRTYYSDRIPPQIKQTSIPGTCSSLLWFSWCHAQSMLAKAPLNQIMVQNLTSYRKTRRLLNSIPFNFVMKHDGTCNIRGTKYDWLSSQLIKVRGFNFLKISDSSKNLSQKQNLPNCIDNHYGLIRSSQKVKKF